MDMIRHSIGPDAAPAAQVSPVNSHNEWDPLEEVIVGRLEGATIPSGHPVVTCNIPGMAAWAQSLVAGCRYPKIMIEPAQRELDGFVALLQSMGIVVTRPDRLITRNASARRNGPRTGSAIPVHATACL
jgi:glycine amidinotransferase